MAKVMCFALTLVKNGTVLQVLRAALDTVRAQLTSHLDMTYWQFLACRALVSRACNTQFSFDDEAFHISENALVHLAVLLTVLSNCTPVCTLFRSLITSATCLPAIARATATSYAKFDYTSCCTAFWPAADGIEHKSELVERAASRNNAARLLTGCRFGISTFGRMSSERLVGCQISALLMIMKALLDALVIVSEPYQQQQQLLLCSNKQSVNASWHCAAIAASSYTSKHYSVAQSEPRWS
eukprot:5550-Heterococcus_DN1.PRE.8